MTTDVDGLPRRRLWPWALALLGLALVCGLCASALGAVAPDYRAIVIVGPFESGKVRVVLWTLAVALPVLVGFVSASAAAVRRSTWWSGPLVLLLSLAMLPIMGLILLVAALFYDQQPETHRFTVDGERYALTSQVGFLIAADDTYLHLFRREGARYVLTDTALPVADSVAFRDGFTLEESNGLTSIVYVDASDTTVRIAID
jgi:hypothetical protein